MFGIEIQQNHLVTSGFIDNCAYDFFAFFAKHESDIFSTIRGDTSGISGTISKKGRNRVYLND